MGGSSLGVAVHTGRIGAHVALISKPGLARRNLCAQEFRGGLLTLDARVGQPCPGRPTVQRRPWRLWHIRLDRAGLAFTAEAVAHVTGSSARHVQSDGFTQGALNVDSQVTDAQQ